ncbi:hypothetical protein [Aquibium microcysteis]|uniref:hypothetical protein n=1 Tax=Aquibium microcysteis TaxID=675281 RepID=UPI00165CFE15|nr:hypothetical protein [Aquibium microcysteis]
MGPTRFALMMLAGTTLFGMPAAAQQEGAASGPSEVAPAATSQNDLLRQARELFEATRGDTCDGSAFGEDPPPEIHTISFRPSYADDEAPLEEATLFRFFCGAGAYNETHAYFLHTAFDGLRRLAFAEPELQIRHEDEDSEKPVEEMRIIGFTAQPVLVNSEFVAEEHAILSHAKWRGPGDASATGLWLFRDGDFSLVRYEVDPTYDGEINPQTVLDYYSAP